MYDRPFRWWVQSVMPVVFDDSLSYYEVLAKLTKYIEGLTGDVDQIEKILSTIEGIEDVTQFTEMLESIKSEIGNLTNLSTQTKTDLVSAINEVALKADIAYFKPPTGIPESDLSQGVQDKLNKTDEATKYIINNKELKAAPSNNSPSDLGLGTYSVPSGGIPWDTLSQDVQDRINAGGSGTGGTTDYTDLNNKPQINGHTLNAGNNIAENLGLGTYSKPSTGIPESDLSAEVQEKLNTSGGIADSETSFVATRDYEAGELIYINGVLYKTKYKILSGTNLIPGNNIEVTDISSEIEKINSDIEALQSGSGPDSWNLSAEVESESSTEITNFFEYFNCIGRENYNFILDPVEPTVGYSINIYKRDGTSVRSFDNTTYPNYLNRQRFTFTPTDTGEYYCTIRRSLTSGTEIAHARVTIEYTQSQGISELWAQVNKASQLEPRVGALETLAGEQQTQLGNLTDIPEKVEALEDDVDNIKSAVMQITKTNIGVNIFDEDYDETGYINRGENAASSNYKRTSKYYPVDASKLNIYVYHAQSLSTLSVAFYDSTKTWISNIAANSTGLNTRTIPTNAAFYRSYVDKSFEGNISISYVPVESYTPYQETTSIKDGIVDYENFNQSTKEKIFSWLVGKTIVFMGDSIVGNFYDNTGIAYKLSQLTGATVINCAFGGTQMALRNSNSEVINAWNQLSGCKLSDAIATNTFTAQDAALQTITNEPAYFAERLATLKSVDWNNVDVVMWEYGLNDFQNNQTVIKDETDLTLLTSFYGAYCRTIETLLSAYPHLRIVPISPMWRFWKDGDAYLDGADEHIIGGRLLPEFCECVFEVSKKYHLPYIDDYYELDANQWTRTQYFTTDPAHPDANGRTRIANHIAHKLLTLM